MASRKGISIGMNVGEQGIDVEPTATSPDIGTMSDVEPDIPFIDTSKMRPSDPNIQYEDQVTDRESKNPSRQERIEHRADGSVIIPEPRSFDDVVRDQQASKRGPNEDPTNFPIDE